MFSYERMPKSFHNCFERLVKVCEYLCSEGGLSKENFYFSPPASEEEIAALESRLNTVLPVKYKEFLMIANGAKFIDTEVLGTDRFGIYDKYVPDRFYAVCLIDRSTYRVGISKFDGKAYSMQGGSGFTFTLFDNEMFRLLERLENEADKIKHQKERDAKDPETVKKEMDALVERIKKKIENCPVNTCKKPESVKECVERIRRAAEILENNYGYDTYATFGRSATEEEIIAFETDLGFMLPQEYKEFVRLTGTIEFDSQDEAIYGLEDIGANDQYTPDGYLAMSYVGMTSERLALSLEDGEIELFWDLDSYPNTFLGYITKVLESIEETVSEEYEREETKKMRADGITQEDESEALHIIIQEKTQQLKKAKEAGDQT